MISGLFKPVKFLTFQAIIQTHNKLSGKVFVFFINYINKNESSKKILFIFSIAEKDLNLLLLLSVLFFSN